MSELVDLRISLMGSSQITQLNEVFRIMADSIEINTFARAIVKEIRRDTVLSDINSHHKHLANTTGPEGACWLSVT